MVKYIEINAKQMPVCFSMRALNHFCIKHGLTIGSLTKQFGTPEDPSAIKLTFQQVADLFEFALKEGHRKEGEKFKLSNDDVIDLFDEKQGLLPEVLELFADSVYQKFSSDDEKNAKAPKAKKANGAK